jgi:translation initiation factor eIF-2B subunit epsilon
VPIIEYTLELLVTAGVKELFVVCSTHAEKIQDYCADSPACQQFAVHVLNVPGCKSMGEAMREVYSRGNIRGDFILVSGDVVSNIKLEPALKAHKRRREEEKNKDAVRAPLARPPAPSPRSLLLGTCTQLRRAASPARPPHRPGAEARGGCALCRF